MRILVIDDDRVVARSVARMLRGHDVKIETSPEVAVDRLIRASERFDLILCDFNMPVLKGSDVLEIVRGHAIGHPIFILMSANENSETAADAKLSKPFDASELRTVVARLELAQVQLREAETQPMRPV